MRERPGLSLASSSVPKRAAATPKTLFLQPGSPRKNGYVESFNGKLRDELLNGEIFYTLREAQVIIECWRREYNTFRPHSALGYRPQAPETVQWPPWPRDEKLLLALT